jgi:hypothetical protein
MGGLPTSDVGHIGLKPASDQGGEEMDFGEQTTGTRDEQYNLISVLYHALHGAETTEMYTLDAEAAGDERLAAFFREAQTTQRQLAERAKGLLGILEVPPEAEVGSDVPPEGGITPGEMSGGMPPGSVEVQREPEVPGEEVGVPAREARPTIDEGVVREPGGVPPGDVREGTSPERSPREAPPAGLAEDAEAADVPPDVPPPHIPVASTPEEGPAASGRTPEQQTARQTEGEQEEKEKKGLIDRAIDKAADKLRGQ